MNDPRSGAPRENKHDRPYGAPIVRDPTLTGALIMALGIAVAFGGALVWYQTITDVRLCANALVGALQQVQCAHADATHTLGAVAFVVGLLLTATGIIYPNIKR